MAHEKSTTFKYKGDWVNVASVIKGKQKTDKELKKFKETVKKQKKILED